MIEVIIYDGSCEGILRLVEFLSFVYLVAYMLLINCTIVILLF